MMNLQEAARRAIEQCMGWKPEESILVVTDAPCRTVGLALFDVARQLTDRALLLEYPPLPRNGAEPPSPVSSAMKRFQVVLAPTSTSLTHTRARRKACEAGARVGTLPGISEEMMRRTMAADYQEIAQRTYQLTRLLTEGKLARITSRAGTDIRVPIEGIRAIASTGLIHRPGQFGNLPSGEAYLMPREGESEGVVVVDGSMAGIGLIEEQPIRLVVERGMAVAVEGGREARRLNEMLEAVGPKARNLAELGVGTNHAARITGAVLEDEKVMGTVHLALGNNASMGGTVTVPLHLDGVLRRPTLWVDDRLVLEEGRWMLGD
ncbi:MAG: aminopeptidase [Calditrichaeota bacterium]|nr:MAG: aminopeptidase [Calditrichota bacterium]